MTIATPPDLEQRFVIDEVDWDFYETVLRQLGDRHVFVTYNQGRLELMSPSYRHDQRARLVGIFISILCEELEIPMTGAGSTTFRRKEKETGLEPDQCFYVQHVDAIQGKDEIDLAVDPPPDLAIEIEISRRMIKRIPLYVSLGIPELWRDDGKRLRMFALRSGDYEEVDRSLAFGMVTGQQVSDLLDLAADRNEMRWTRSVREWVRKNLGSNR